MKPLSNWYTHTILNKNNFVEVNHFYVIVELSGCYELTSFNRAIISVIIEWVVVVEGKMENETFIMFVELLSCGHLTVIPTVIK